MYFQYVSVWPIDLIVDSIPDIITSYVVIGFGVCVLYSQGVKLCYLSSTGLFSYTKSIQWCLYVYKTRGERNRNHCTQNIVAIQTTNLVHGLAFFVSIWAATVFHKHRCLVCWLLNETLFHPLLWATHNVTSCRKKFCIQCCLWFLISHPLKIFTQFFFFFVGTIVPWQLRKSWFYHNRLDTHNTD